MTRRFWFVSLILLGIIIRLGLWACYEPTIYPDTGTYSDAAKDLVTGTTERDEGRRTPGYPVIFLVGGFDPNNIWLIQSALGLGTSALLFYLAFALTGRAAFAFAAGMAYNLNLSQIFFEAALLSESTTTFIAVAVAALTVNILHRLRSGGTALALLPLLGLLGGYLILLRPQFVFLILLLPVLVTYGRFRLQLKAAFQDIGLVALPTLAMVISWCLWVYVNLGFFTLSTQTGFALANHSTGFVELAADRYATIRDIMLRYRAARLEAGLHYSNTVFDALPELRQVTGLSRPGLAREVQAMSLDLFAKHPVKYALSVSYAWTGFWAVDNYWQLDKVSPGWLVSPLVATWWLEHKLLRMVNAAFIVLLASVLVSRAARRRISWDVECTTIGAMILLSSMVQALAEYGGNPRYGVTVQPLTLFLLMLVCYRLFARGSSVEAK